MSDLLTRDEIRQKLRILMYQEQQPLTRIAKDCGMDAKTIDLASRGEMTNRTQIRFTRWFEQRARGIAQPRIRENYTVLSSGSKKDITIVNIGRLFKEMRSINGYNGYSRARMETMTQDELNMLFYQTENKLKFMLLKKHKPMLEHFHMWLFDKWDYWQWKEKVELTLTDTARFATFQPR